MSIDSSKLTRKERKSAIIGMVLGDASLCRNRFRDGSYQGNAKLNMTHSIKQKEYMEYKMSILQPMFGYELKIQHTYYSAGNDKKYPVVRLQTRVNTQLTGIRKMLYDSETNKKHVTREVLDMLDDRAVAIWYMDDGCLSLPKERGKIVILCTNSFTFAENELIRDWFYERYGVSFNINEHKASGTYNLRRGISDAHKLLDAIKPYTIPLLRYKVDYPPPKRPGGWYNLPCTAPGSCERAG